MAYRASKVIAIYVLLTTFSILFTYALSVGLGHISPFVPYLGFTGDLPPESTVFTQCYVVDAAVLMLVVQVQYVYVSACLSKTQASREAFALNTAGACIGHAAAMGLFLHACFQESHAYYVHHLGEFLYLVGSTAYFGCQTALSRLRKDGARLRLALSAFMGALLVVFVVGYVVAVRGLRKEWAERYFWGAGDEGWVPHLLSAAAEWALISLFQCYLLTFVKDFRRVLLTKTSIVVVHEEGEELS